MSETTKIQWADATFNPWIGCTKVSPGCKNCYAENTTRARVLRSQGQETWGKGAKRSRTSPATWRGPVKWNGEPRMEFEHRLRIFPSLCDWLDDEVPVEWLADFLKLIHETPNIIWILLTKRPENFKRARMALESRWKDSDQTWVSGWCDDNEQVKCPDNVWILASVENQATADSRIPELLKIPAKVRGLSVEPMLEGISLTKIGHDYEYIDALRGLHCQFNSDGQCRESNVAKIDWAIFGGESGPNARPCNVEWIRDGVRQCDAAGVAVFVKQLGQKPVGLKEGFKLRDREEFDPENPNKLYEYALADKKGGDFNEWPEDLRRREFPKV